MSLALHCLGEGRIEEAERLCRQLLAERPGHPQGLHMSGMFALHAGRYADADALLSAASTALPTNAHIQEHLGVVRQELGRPTEAAHAYREALRLRPSAGAWMRLGLLSEQVGDAAGALDSFAAAAALEPDNADAHNNLGVMLGRTGRQAEAIAAYRKALRLRPSAGVWMRLGLLLEKVGDLAGALDSFAAAAALAPDDAETHNNLGVMLDRADRYEEAMAAFARALQLRPDYADAHLNVAMALRASGEAHGARAAIQRALAADPAHAYGWYILSTLKTFAPDDPDIATLEALQTGTEHEPKARADLAFALGKAKMDARDVDGAFASFAVANRIARARFDYAVEGETAWMQRIAETFSPAFMDRFTGGGAASELPVFVLGMPRSGTTLVEQILASHPALAAAGELLVPLELRAGLGAAEMSREGGDGRFRASLRDVAATCLRQLEPFSRGAPRATNKSAGLFPFAGLLRLALPGARFIHCRRDPVDTCFSCYTKNFAFPQPFAYDLRELGAYYRGYADLMAHWRAILPSECLLEVDYEALTGDLDGEARRLLAFVGLGWDDACLEFHRNTRRVGTASCDQVRKPIYRSSVGRWRPYAHHLSPLLAALGDDWAAAPRR